MREPIESEYFNWLCTKVIPVNGQNYKDLMRILYTTEFVWIIHRDRNRAEDGIELREDFLRESDWDADPLWLNEPCSLLEMFIAFAKRASFQTDNPVEEWFWIFMANLGLDDFYRVSRSDQVIIQDILFRFTSRTYNANGEGGMFPLLHPRTDQRNTEIWYAFCAWVEEKELI